MKGLGKHKKLLTEKIFHLYFERALSFEVLFQERENYKEFWDLFCLALDKFRKANLKYEDLDNPDVKNLALKSFQRKVRSVYGIERFADKIKDLKIKRDIGENFLEPINQVVMTDTKEDVIFNDDGRELVRTKTQEIRQMKIERIEFSSPVTIDAINIASETQKATSEFFQDLMRKVKGEETKKHQFIHLDMATKVKKLALDLLDGMEEAIECSDDEQRKEINKKITQVMKFAKVADTVKRMEMQPLYTMNLIHETGANRQKEVNAAITNDRLMIDYGNVKLAPDEKVVGDTAKIRSQIKDKGYIAIDELLIKNLQNAGAYIQEEEQKIENTEPDIPDEEFEEFDEELT